MNSVSFNCGWKALAIVLAAGTFSNPVWAQQKQIRIAQIVSLTGLAEAYGRGSLIGLQMGLEYATKGTMEIAGKKIVIAHKDDQSKPDVAKRLIEEAYGDGEADIAVGANSTAATLTMIPIAAQYKKILVIDGAQADSITGEYWNPYIFRVKQTTTQEAAGAAAAADVEGASIATLSYDSVAGRDNVKAFRAALKNATLVHEEFAPPATSDFTAAGQRIIEKLRGAPGRKIVYIVAWIGPADPYKIGDLGLERYGIEVVGGGNILPAMAQQKRFPGMAGGNMYFYGLPQNPVNDWLVKEHQARYGAPPDIFQAFAFAAAMSIATALEKTGGDASAEKLIPAMEGMSFETPKGKMIYRKEDHTALQSVYQTKITVDPKFPWAVPVLVREIKPEEIEIPIRNKR